MTHNKEIQLYNQYFSIIKESIGEENYKKILPSIKQIVDIGVERGISIILNILIQDEDMEFTKEDIENFINKHQIKSIEDNELLNIDNLN